MKTDPHNDLAATGKSSGFRVSGWIKQNRFEFIAALLLAGIVSAVLYFAGKTFFKTLILWIIVSLIYFFVRLFASIAYPGTGMDH